MKHLLNTLYILTPESYLFLQNETIGVKVGGTEMEMSRNVQSGNTQNLKSPLVDQAACCACTHSRYFTGGSPSGLRV